jgi:hypothetical protein
MNAQDFLEEMRVTKQRQQRKHLLLDDLPYAGEILSADVSDVRNRFRVDPDGKPVYDKRIILTFTDGRTLPLEASNLRLMIDALGAETDQWIGQHVQVEVAPHPQRPTVLMKRVMVLSECDDAIQEDCKAPAHTRPAHELTSDEIPF